MSSGLQLDPPQGFKWVKNTHLPVHVWERWSQRGSGGLRILSLALGAVLPTAVCSCSLQPGKGMCWSVCVSVSVCPQVRTCICLWPSSGHSARAALGWDRLVLHKPRSLKGPCWNATSKAG